MAQIMYYHQYPETGSGESNTGTKYQWSNMLPKYEYDYSADKGLYTDEQADAVAQLMLDCGISVGMEYSSKASGAISSYVPSALWKNFGYNKNSIRMLCRDIMPYQEILDIIYEELQAKRPIYVSGSTEDTGHAFVLDGSDGNDYFHINWGWGGLCNGYFRISALDPSEVGIGGSTGGYNWDQLFITGIQPKSESTPETDHYPQLIGRGELQFAPTVNGTNIISSGDKYDGFLNYGIDPDKNSRFDIRQRFTNVDTKEVLYGNYSSYNIPIARGISSIRMLPPNNMTQEKEGVYIIEPEYRLYEDNNQSDEWHEFMFPIGYSGKITAEYTIEKGFQAIASEHPKMLKITKYICPEVIYINMPTSIEFTIENISDKEYLGSVKACVINSFNELSYNYYARERINLMPGETLSKNATFDFDKYINEGKYTTYITDVWGNIISDTLSFEVKEFKIPVDEAHFPDANFRAKISDLCDKDKNGYLSLPEINSRYTLDVTNNDIKSLKGIEYLTKLYSLSANNNKIDSLTIESESQLQYINLNNNNIKHINLSGCKKITTLNMNDNPVTKLLLPKESVIWALSISGGNMDTLDLHDCKSLENLSCSNCNIKYLNLQGCNELKSLYAPYNQLTHFNADELPKLTSATVYGNEHTIEMDKNREFDLGEFIDNGFILSRVSNWKGCTINGTKLSVPRNPAKGTITYNYSTYGTSYTDTYTLNYTHNDLGLVENITLECSTLDMYVGDSEQLKATITPEDAANKTLKWSSSNTEVATVSASGVVTALAIGEVDITAATTDGSNLTAVCHIKVSPRMVSSIKLSDTNIEVVVGYLKSLTVTVLPSNATNRTVKWSVADENIATITSGGMIKGVRVGETDITISATDGSGVSATCHVTVSPVYVTSITLNKDELELEEGESYTLTASAKPIKATNRNVSWASMNEGVATVTSTGVVTAVSKGTAEIRVTAQDGSGVMAVCNVTVIAKNDGVGEIETDKANVTVSDGKIIIEGISEDTIVSVYNPAGQLIRKFKGNEELHLNRGIYILRIGKQMFKIVV